MEWMDKRGDVLCMKEVALFELRAVEESITERSKAVKQGFMRKDNQFGGNCYEKAKS